MNKEQEELLDDVYKNFLKYSSQVIPFTKDEFIHHIKTNDGFAKLWGLKIEELELSESERVQFYYKKHNKGRVGSKTTKFVLDHDNIPTKLITITYNDKTIESYE
jgi:hypothetical protein